MNIKHYAYNKKVWATLIIVLFIVLSWVGNIDKLSDEYTHDSIVQAGTAYAAGRGINAIVSVFQTSTLEFSFFAGGSITVGEMLDPINDLIEKFSNVMIVAFGSLVLQKILLVVTAHGIFNAAVTLLGILLIIMIHMGKVGTLKAVLRLFILFVFVRFSMGIVVSLNGVVDRIFLDSQIVAGSENLNVFRSDLKVLEKEEQFVSKKVEALNIAIRDSKSKLALLEQEIIPELKGKLEEAEKNVADTEAMLHGLEKENRWSALGINESKEVKAAKELLSNHEGSKDDLLNEIDDKESIAEGIRDEIKDDIDSMQELLTEGNKGYLDALWNTVPALKVIPEKVDAAVDNIIELLVLFILKAVLIPLLFFYVLIKVARGIWNVNLEDVFEGNNEVTVSSA